jgi:hypothetical protein
MFWLAAPVAGLSQIPAAWINPGAEFQVGLWSYSRLIMFRSPCALPTQVLLVYPSPIMVEISFL